MTHFTHDPIRHPEITYTDSTTSPSRKGMHACHFHLRQAGHTHGVGLILSKVLLINFKIFLKRV